MRTASKKVKELTHEIDVKLRGYSQEGNIVEYYSIYYIGSKLSFCKVIDYEDQHGEIHTQLESIFTTQTNEEMENVLTGYLEAIEAKK